MALDSKLTITWAGNSYGGNSNTYQIDGAYNLDKSYGQFRLTFNVVVVGTSHANLKSNAGTLETDFRKRDQSLSITIGSSTWTYTAGTHILNSTSSATKTGDSLTDRGFSRAYTCIVEGELPSDDAATGLRDLESGIGIEVGGQMLLTMQGVYTALGGTSASAMYIAGCDAEATTLIAAAAASVARSPTFEMVDEQYTHDRNDHTCQFSRQYLEVLADQSQGVRDDTAIKDFKMTFTVLAQHPGDSEEGIYRLRHVIGTYDCALDVAVGTDLQSVYSNKVEAHVKALFESTFSPQDFTVANHRLSYDESTKRMSVAIQFLYHPSGGTEIIEVNESKAYRELRTVDKTPLHYNNEFAAEVAVGWATRERIAVRTVVALGEVEPQRRLGVKPDEAIVGAIKGIEAGPNVIKAGWNIISNTSQVTAQWVGDPSGTQLRQSVLVETVVEGFNVNPGTGTVPSAGQSRTPVLTGDRG